MVQSTSPQVAPDLTMEGLNMADSTLHVDSVHDSFAVSAARVEDYDLGFDVLYIEQIFRTRSPHYCLDVINNTRIVMNINK